MKHEFGGNVKILFVYLCHISSVVTPWSLTQEVGGSINPFNDKYFWSLNLADSVNICIGKLKCIQLVRFT